MAANSASQVVKPSINPNVSVSGIGQAAQYLQSRVDQQQASSAEQAAILRDWQAEQNRIAMEFSAAEAAKNRDWQEMMSNTAHQRISIRAPREGSDMPTMAARSRRGHFNPRSP